MLFALALPLVLAADEPRVYVVGLHVAGLIGDQSGAAAESLTRALDASGKVDGYSPSQTSAVITGRESLILDDYALGPGKELLQNGRLLYERATPDAAIIELDKAVSALSAGLAVSTDTRPLHEAYMLLGVSYVGLGDEANARAAFRRSVMLDPSRELDDVKYPPDVVKLFNEQRLSLAKESPAKISITASTDAIVFVDGKDRGPVSDAAISVVPGTHYVLVRSPSGASHFEVVAVRAGGSAKVDALLSQRSVGVPDEATSARSKQVRALYEAVGHYATGGLVVFGGELDGGQVGVQLYAPASGSFSKPLLADAGDDAVTAINDLVPALAGYVTESGDIRPDRVSAAVLALDVSTNDVLAGLLYDPPKAGSGTVARSGPKWWVWAGIGAVVAGGGATATAIALTSGDGGDGGGTVSFGPIP